MDMYTAVKNRILQLLGEKRMSIHRLALESAVAPSSIKNILYGKSQNPGVVTIKMLCDGFGITLIDFFNTPDFEKLEQEIKYVSFAYGGYIEIHRLATTIGLILDNKKEKTVKKTKKA